VNIKEGKREKRELYLEKVNTQEREWKQKKEKEKKESYCILLK